jgi:16S rRNA (guanine1516-N2)-methyltransferase
MDNQDLKVNIDANQEFSDLIDQFPEFSFEITKPDSEAMIFLHKSPKFGLGIMAKGEPDLFLPIDFQSAELQKRKRFFSPKKEPLLKAIGKLGEKEYILDATAGLGRESFLLASSSYNVKAIEQSPYLYILLRLALSDLYEKLELPVEKQRLSFHFGDFFQYKDVFAQKPAVVYIDPMFPDSKKSAKVKKPMQVLQRMNLKAFGPEEYLEKALAMGAGKVVFKRPKEAPVLAPERMQEYYENETIRFEVY